MLSTLKTVQTNGDIYTKLSLLVFGLGNMKRGQMAKGLIFLAIEIAALIWFFTIGLQKILELPGSAAMVRKRKKKSTDTGITTKPRPRWWYCSMAWWLFAASSP